MNDQGRTPRGSLFNDDAGGSAGAPQRERPSRLQSVNFWLNVGFVVVLLGLLFGADASPWFYAVAVLWIGTGVFVTVRRRRHEPAPRSLFEDEE